MAIPVPNHIAIVMDGNGRWANRRFMPRLAGHHQGVDALRRCVQACLDRGVGTLTVFAFSSENWDRPAEEVSGLMSLMVSVLAKEVVKLKANGAQLHFVGNLSALSDKVRNGLLEAEKETSGNRKLVLNEPITEKSLDRAMALAHSPDPDLLIRTGGEFRISNFLLWQTAYSELVFSDKLWPEFDEAALDEAIAVYNGRERRFGKTSAQVAPLAANPTT